MDVSPEGDPAGFVRVIDETALAIPERPGNRGADTFHNVLETAAVGLILLMPGVDETLRVNRTASSTVDPDVLAPMAVSGRFPQLALLVHIEEAFFHCGKALKRSALWSNEGRVDRSVLPSMGAASCTGQDRAVGSRSRACTPSQRTTTTTTSTDGCQPDAASSASRTKPVGMSA